MDCGNYCKYNTFIKKEKIIEIKNINTNIHDHFGMLALYNLEIINKKKQIKKK